MADLPTCESLGCPQYDEGRCKAELGIYVMDIDRLWEPGKVCPGSGCPVDYEKMEESEGDGTRG